MGELIISPMVQMAVVMASSGMVRATPVSEKPSPHSRYPSAMTGRGGSRACH